MDLRPLLLIAAVLLAGCLESAPASDDGPKGIDAYSPQSTETYPLLDPLLGPNGMANRFSIDLGNEATFLELQGGWRCVSMCPLAFSILDPQGHEVASGHGGYGWQQVVQVTMPGTWTVEYTAAQDAAVGIQGEASLTVY